MILTAHDKRHAGLARIDADCRRHGINEMARQAGISSKTVHSRLRAGWSLDDALNTRPMSFSMAGKRSAALRALRAKSEETET